MYGYEYGFVMPGQAATGLSRRLIALRPPWRPVRQLRCCATPRGSLLTSTEHWRATRASTGEHHRIIGGHRSRCPIEYRPVRAHRRGEVTMAIPQKRTTKRQRAKGDMSLGVTRREDADNLMGAALTLHPDADGGFHVVDLELDDVKGVFEDTVRLPGANAEQVALWWRRLADLRDGPPAASGGAMGAPRDQHYGAPHRQLRARVAKVVASGNAVCWRCRQWIRPGEPWHLGHADVPGAKARGVYGGPEHAACSHTSGGWARQGVRRDAPAPPEPTCAANDARSEVLLTHGPEDRGGTA